jgi:hypothetical protein
MNNILLLTLALNIVIWFQLPAFAVEKEPTTCPVFNRGRQVGELEHPAITEASGMAASRLQNDMLWIINDGDNGSFLYAVGPTGKHLSRVGLYNAPNIDWEDLAAFQWQGTAYLLVADFGDNEAERENGWIYILPEPNLSGANGPQEQTVDWEWRIKFFYADGPRDSESVAVDISRQKILIITKRKWPPELYELPLAPRQKKSVYVAHRLGTIPHIPKPTLEDIRKNPIFGRFFSQPTAMDLSPNGRWAVILCYKNAYLFAVTPETSWQEVFGQVPQIIELPRFNQAEAVSFSEDGRSLYITSEQRPAPLCRLERDPECPEAGL